MVFASPTVQSSVPVGRVRGAEGGAAMRVLVTGGTGFIGSATIDALRAKERAEAALRDSGLEYAIFRPSWIYGRRDRSLNRFIQLVRYLPVVPVIGDGQARVQPALVDDVARVVALAVDEPRASGQAF